MSFHTIPFNIGDWLGGTLGWDALECGVYINLIMAHYSAGIRGLEDDEKELAKFAKCSVKVWRRVSKKVLVKFDLADGYWTQDKCVKVLSKKKDKPEVIPNDAESVPGVHPKDSRNFGKSLKENDSENTNTISNIQYPISSNTHTPPPDYFKPPSWVPGLAWEGYLAVRDRIPNCGNTKQELNALLSTLQLLQMRGANIEQVLHEATLGRWKTLHMDKFTQNSQRSKTHGRSNPDKFNASSAALEFAKDFASERASATGRDNQSSFGDDGVFETMECEHEGADGLFPETIRGIP